MVKKHKKTKGAGGKPHPKEGKGPMVQVTFNVPELLKNWDFSGAKPIIEAIEKERGSRLICLVYNDSPPVPSAIAPPVLGRLKRILSHLGKVDKIDIFLRSTGGRTEIPWRIVSLLREFTSDTIGVIVGDMALSGATHIAIAADELIMTAFSVISSVDPTRQHPLLPKNDKGQPIPTSVEDLKHCIRFIQEQLGESYHKQDLAVIISELFKYVDPLAIGALEQSYKLSRLITEKCLSSRKNPPNDEQVEKIVDKLSGGYFSHTFLISRAEIESDLGLPVVKPNEKLTDLIFKLNDYYLTQFNKTVLADQKTPGVLFRLGGFVQLMDMGSVIGTIFREDGQLISDPWLDFNL